MTDDVISQMTADELLVYRQALMMQRQGVILERSTGRQRGDFVCLT